MPTLRLILWPSVITLLVSVARFVAETQGLITTQSGGALSPLGISWLPLVFGIWFATRLRSAGFAPRLKNGWPWPLIALLAFVGAVAWQFAPLRGTPATETTFEELRMRVLVIVGVAIASAIAAAIAWPRLAWTLLCYAIPARATVVLLTWIAKLSENGADGATTHYTKFGPQGVERDMGETMVSAAVAQAGAWVPFTIITGMLTGTLFVRRK